MRPTWRSRRASARARWRASRSPPSSCRERVRAGGTAGRRRQRSRALALRAPVRARLAPVPGGLRPARPAGGRARSPHRLGSRRRRGRDAACLHSRRSALPRRILAPADRPQPPAGEPDQHPRGQRGDCDPRQCRTRRGRAAAPIPALVPAVPRCGRGASRFARRTRHRGRRHAQLHAGVRRRIAVVACRGAVPARRSFRRGTRRGDRSPNACAGRAKRALPRVARRRRRADEPGRAGIASGSASFRSGRHPDDRLPRILYPPANNLPEESMSLTRRTLVAAGALLASAGAAVAFPDRPVQIIVPWAAGGGTDTVVRIFAAGFEKELGVPVNVVNRVGGNGITGHSAIANAVPDGYTIGAASPEIAFYKALGTGDLTPASFDLFSRIALIPAGVTVKADAPYKSLADFLKVAKDSPKGTLMASGTGTGGSWHIAAGGLMKSAGLEADRLRWVPSQGGAPALQDVAAGGITAFTGSPIEAKSLMEAGKVRVLALMTSERQATFPDIPTTKEAGLDWVYENWFALVAPKGMAPDRREKLFESAKRAMAQPEVQNALKQRGIAPVWDAPGEFERYLGGFVDRGTAVLKELELAK